MDVVYIFETLVSAYETVLGCESINIESRVYKAKLLVVGFRNICEPLEMIAV